jgi:hypothetical protein
MWKYKRRLSIHPIVSTVSFAGQRLTVAPDGSILTPIDDALALKMKRAQHIFISDAPAAPTVEPPAVELVEAAAVEQEQVESSSTKDDNDKAMRKRKRRKVEG